MTASLTSPMFSPMLSSQSRRRERPMSEREKLHKIIDALPDDFLHMVYVAADTLKSIADRRKDEA